LAKADPGNAEWQHNLSGSYAKIASVYREASQPQRAREALASGRAIIARMVADHPNQAEWKQDLAEFDAQIEALENENQEAKPAQNKKQGQTKK
jgi:cell pole-organizing protein PopZ